MALLTDFKTRLNHALGPESMDRVEFLGRSSLFASFIRIPTYFLINNVFFRIAGQQNEGKGPSSLKMWGLSLLQNFAIPLTLGAGSFINEFFSADIKQGDRATQQGEEVLKTLSALDTTFKNIDLNASEQNITQSAAAEQRTLQHSYIQQVMEGDFSPDAIAHSIQFLSSLIRTSIAQAQNPSKDVDTLSLDTHTLEIVTAKMQTLSADKTIYSTAFAGQFPDAKDGELLHSVEGTQQRMSQDEVGIFVQDMLKIATDHIPMNTLMDVMKVETAVNQTHTLTPTA